MSDEKVLVAGLGDLDRGDDAFGIRAVGELQRRGTQPDVCISNFGADGHELAAEIRNGYDAIILLKTAGQGRTPGTLHVFDPDVEPVEAGQAIFACTRRTPEDGLRVLEALDGFRGRIYIIGCEPQSFETAKALSEPVEASVPHAVTLLETLLSHLRTERSQTHTDRSPATGVALPQSMSNREPVVA